jgi:hypothetical protein
MSVLYATVLILHPSYRIKYIELNWPKKLVKATLNKVKKLWNDYREAPLSNSLLSLLYNKPVNHTPNDQLWSLNTFNQIAQSLRQTN